MTPFIRLYVNWDRPGGQACRCLAYDDSSPTSSRLTTIQGDVFQARVFLFSWVSGSIANVRVDGGFAVYLCLAKEDDLDAASHTDILRVTLAESADSGVSGYYAWMGDVDLSGSAILTALGTSDSISAVLDVRISDGTDTTTYRIPCTIYRAAIELAAPSSTLGATMVNSAFANMRQKANGTFQFYDHTTALWRTPVLQDGVLGWSTGEA